MYTVRRGAVRSIVVALATAVTGILANAALASEDPPLKFLPFVKKPAPFLYVPSIDPAAMNGWTPVTKGRAKGGPSVFRLADGSTLLIVRAQDDSLYYARIDPAKPAIVADEAWFGGGSQLRSEPDCTSWPYYNQTLKRGVVCAHLGDHGAAAATAFYAVVNGGPTTTFALGGSNAGARPAIAAREQDFFLLVWDGEQTVFRSKPIDYQKPGSPAYSQPGNWTRLAGIAQTPLGCMGPSYPTCLYGVGDVVNLVWFNDATTARDRLPPVLAASPPVPGGLSRRVAPVIVTTKSGRIVAVVRGGDGHILWSAKIGDPRDFKTSFGAWHDAGASTMADSGLSCLTTGETLVCWVQGADGRIYTRYLGNVMGL